MNSKLNLFWDGPMPVGIKMCVQTMHERLGAEIRTWTWKDIPTSVVVMLRGMPVRAQSDYLRMWILHAEGGLFLDSDHVVMRPWPWERAAKEAGKFGLLCMACRPNGVNNAELYASRPGLPILKRILARMERKIGGNRNASKGYDEIARKSSDVIIVPRIPYVHPYRKVHAGQFLNTTFDKTTCGCSTAHVHHKTIDAVSKMTEKEICSTYFGWLAGAVVVGENYGGHTGGH